VTTREFVQAKKELKHMQLQGTSNPNQFTLFGNGFTFFDLNITAKIGVHYSLYLKTLEKLGTSELHNSYYQKACKFEDFGCFALTEFLHGSNVKGMLTEAHYDHASRELVIHTPSKEAMKFWIGGAGKTSNMAIVWAQLYIDNKCYGVHAMVVPLRDDRTHKVLPGIRIGDCGPKFGLDGVDNAFIEFNHFRVPVGNLLDKVSGINEDGEFFNYASS
jgi:acyl-CoA oxidase